MTTMQDSIERVMRALDEIRAGKMVILVDDEDRENEGDLVIPAQFATPEQVNFMARFGRGLICLVKLTPFGVDVIPHEKTYAGPIEDRLQLMMSSGAQLSPVFGLFIDFRHLGDGVDIKFLWEVNRHLWWVPIAQQYALTGDRRCLDRIGELLKDWLTACPYARGANWSSPVEHGIRLITGGRVVALDILAMDAIPGAETIEMDFLDEGAPARLDELITIAARISAFGRTSFTLHCGIFRGEERLTDIEISYAHIDSDSGQPTPLPGSFIAEVRRFESRTPVQG